MAGYFSKHIGAVAFFAVGLTSPAWAADCPPLVKIASVKLQPLAKSRRLLVPITINNVPKNFLLDTAGTHGFITKESADALQLPNIALGGAVKVVRTFGLGGRTYELPATENTDTTLIASLNATSDDRDGDIDGTLTNAYLLTKGELDLDFPGGTLSLFSPDHCPGNVNYWGAPDIDYLPLSDDVIAPAVPDRVTFERMKYADFKLKNDISHLTIPVTLDGHALNAWIDTSADKSSVSVEVAERLFNLQEKDLGPTSDVKVTPEAVVGFFNPSPQMPPGRIASGRITVFDNHLVNDKTPAKAKVYRHTFSSLTIGHVGIKNLEMLIVPELWGRNNDLPRRLAYTPQNYIRSVWNYDMAGVGELRGDQALLSNAKKDVPDMVLGLDVLRHLHIYLSLKEKRMYFSAGTAPPPVSKTTAN